jgi:hypothetical protein
MLRFERFAFCWFFSFLSSWVGLFGYSR